MVGETNNSHRRISQACTCSYLCEKEKACHLLQVKIGTSVLTRVSTTYTSIDGCSYGPSAALQCALACILAVTQAVSLTNLCTLVASPGYRQWEYRWSTHPVVYKFTGMMSSILWLLGVHLPKAQCDYGACLLEVSRNIDHLECCDIHWYCIMFSIWHFASIEFLYFGSATRHSTTVVVCDAMMLLKTNYGWM